jgi:lipopolysaccharide transport system ATP-binding protein
MSRPAISVENLSKAYRIGLKDEVPDTLVGALQGALRAPMKNWRRLARLNTFKHQEEADDLFWALKDVSFDVAEGEVVGIIGRNGAGKSTLLKILSRITEPTSGRAVIRGRVSSLLEVGTGFHPELTGRDNVYMNGTILGMTKREIDRKFDEIVDFSGVAKFLDTPIKHYSSGMKVRLAFAVAAHLEPEILIIDEVLAVGDAEFQKRCLGKMQEVALGGRTVLFVSHNLGAVQSLCTKGILLNQGTLTCNSEVTEALRKYVRSFGGCGATSLNAIEDRQGSGCVRLTGISITRPDRHGAVLQVGQPMQIAIDYETEVDRQRADVAVGIYNSQGQRVTWLGSRLDMSHLALKAPRGTVVCTLYRVQQMPDS